MTSSNNRVFSEALQKITDTKLEELSKRRLDFETTKANTLSMLEGEEKPTERLRILSEGVKACYALKSGKGGKVDNAAQSKNSELELELKNLDCFLAQAKYDPSLSTKTMRHWEESLLHHLEAQSLKYQYASLYAKLVTEWLSTEKSKTDEVDVAMSEGFEDVHSAMKQDAREQWERAVFEPANVNEDELQAYLDRLFGEEDTEPLFRFKALKKLRDAVANFESEMSAPNQFTPSTLKWACDGLLSSDLLSDEKREVLKDFKNNPVILGDVADVLNMRITSLETWSWGPIVTLEQQRQINGSYNILMQEDLIQAIFLQHIGVKWSVFFKKAFNEFQKTPGAWEAHCKPIPKADARRREYYLGPEDHKKSVRSIRDAIYRKRYFMAQLMDNDSQRNEAAQGEEEAEYQAGVPAQAMQTYPRRRFVQTASFGLPSVRRQMASQPGQHQDQFNDDDVDDENSGSESPMQSKQRLLRLLSTEIAINTKLYGEITAIHSVFERWNSLLPHETLLKVLSFFGVSATWLSFFKKFLKAPLKFLDDDPSAPTRTRSRGTPASHVLSGVFGEVIMFCLDFSVNQSTGGAMLFRMQDDFWFWSRDHSTAVAAWKSVAEFVKATGTYIDLSKTGTMRISRSPGVSLEIDRTLPKGDIRWGFLRLSPQTGRFEIDQSMVDKHIIELRKQLHDKQNSIISFIQAWNTYAATFFTSNFGKAANCFGRDHVSQMLATHERIQREVFSSSSSLIPDSGIRQGATNIVDYLKGLIKERFDTSDVPDAYFYFPMEVGGLDLKSPFISILQVHDTVTQDPTKILDAFFEVERDAYNSRKIAFENGSTQRDHRLAVKWEPDNKLDVEEFMSFAEYIRYREDAGYNFDNSLYHVYKRLMKVPKEEGIQTASARVMSGISGLKQQGALKGITGDWSSMDPYWKWVAALYGPEVMDRFGGLNLVEPGLLPMGMVSIFRDKRIKWQG